MHDHALAAVAGVFHIMNHATFKASLFMAAGIIDHEAGTRDIKRLGGLMTLMPISATLAVIAALNLLPPAWTRATTLCVSSSPGRVPGASAYSPA